MSSRASPPPTNGPGPRPRLLVAAYRDWALGVAEALARTHPLTVARDPASLTALAAELRPDVVALVGWSWRVEAALLEAADVVGMHPSALPAYAGGSPVQHQIIDGLEDGTATLFRLEPTLDSGPILDQEPVDLRGHLDEVFASIARASETLLRRYLARWPDNPARPQPPAAAPPRRRLTPADSRLDRAELARLSCRELWNRIRAREAPYPSVFLEDETGRLTLLRAEFAPAPPPPEGGR